MNILVTDTLHHEQFPLDGVFHGSTGAGAITSTPGSYSATFAQGGSVSIVDNGTTLVSGMPVLHGSTLLATTSDNTGSFSGEFLVTAVDSAVLHMFGLGPAWSPDGSISITFGQDDIDGNVLEGIIGGGTVTIETPVATVVPDPATLMLFASGMMICGIYGAARRIS
jgi:hypothetical protein